MSWLKSTSAISVFMAFALACAANDEFQPSHGAKDDAGTDTGRKKVGANCTEASDCESGFCADGVCCDGACDGECTSCAVPTREGTCSPLPTGTKDSCAGDGPCAGSCDGAGACAYPGSTTSCGVTSCSGSMQTGALCDGSGACKSGKTSCGMYRCGATACFTSCTTSDDCALGNHCDENGACVGKSTNGASCKFGTDCESNECVDGICCETACAAPSSCATGACVCGDVTCTEGDTCITWYADTDGDGFGDPANTKAGCASTGPSGGMFVKNDDDCYDKNISAKPGQSAYFVTHRGDGSFDYDCNGASNKQYVSVQGLTCGGCGASFGSIGCWTCGQTVGGTTLYPNGYGCTKNNCTESKPSQGFKAEVACGANATLYTCSASSCSGETQSSAQQACR